MYNRGEIKRKVNENKMDKFSNFIELILNNSNIFLPKRDVENMKNVFYEQLLCVFMDKVGFQFISRSTKNDDTKFDKNNKMKSNKIIVNIVNNIIVENKISYAIPFYLKCVLESDQYSDECLIKILIGDYVRLTPNKDYFWNNISRKVFFILLVLWRLCLISLPIITIVLPSVNKINNNNFFQIIIPMVIALVIAYAITSVILLLVESCLSKQIKDNKLEDMYSFNKENVDNSVEEAIKMYKNSISDMKKLYSSSYYHNKIK